MPIKLSKNYIPNEKEKYMCSKHKEFFKRKLQNWKNEIITSKDMVDQATSQTEKNLEIRTVNRQIKLIKKIDSTLKKIKNNTYGYCEETGDPIGIKRLIARPIATLSIEAQEKHEKNEKIFTKN